MPTVDGHPDQVSLLNNHELKQNLFKCVTHLKRLAKDQLQGPQPVNEKIYLALEKELASINCSHEVKRRIKSAYEKAVKYATESNYRKRNFALDIYIELQESLDDKRLLESIKQSELLSYSYLTLFPNHDIDIPLTRDPSYYQSIGINSEEITRRKEHFEFNKSSMDEEARLKCEAEIIAMEIAYRENKSDNNLIMARAFGILGMFVGLALMIAAPFVTFGLTLPIGIAVIVPSIWAGLGYNGMSKSERAEIDDKNKELQSIDSNLRRIRLVKHLSSSDPSLDFDRLCSLFGREYILLGTHTFKNAHLNDNRLVCILYDKYIHTPNQPLSDALSRLLDNPNVISQAKSGETLGLVLHIAARAGRLDVVQSLLDTPETAEKANWAKNLALKAAVKHGHKEVYDYLMQNSAVVKDAAIDDNVVLRYAIRAEQFEMAADLLQMPVVLQNAAVLDNAIIRLIHEHSKDNDQNYDSVVRQLLANEFVLRQALDGDSQNIVLELILRTHNMEALQNIMAAAVDKHVGIGVRFYERVIKQVLFTENNDAMTFLLSTQPDKICEVIADEGTAVLEYAVDLASEGNSISFAVLEKLMKMPQLEKTLDKRDNSLLRLVYEKWSEAQEQSVWSPILENLFNNVQVNKSARSGEGFGIMLELAASHGRLDVIDRLLDSREQQDKAHCRNNRALIAAVKSGQIEVVLRLLEIPNVLQNAADKNCTMLHAAIAGGNPVMVARVLEIPGIAQQGALRINSILLSVQNACASGSESAKSVAAVLLSNPEIIAAAKSDQCIGIALALAELTGEQKIIQELKDFATLQDAPSMQMLSSRSSKPESEALRKAIQQIVGYDDDYIAKYIDKVDAEAKEVLGSYYSHKSNILLNSQQIQGIGQYLEANQDAIAAWFADNPDDEVLRIGKKVSQRDSQLQKGNIDRTIEIHRGTDGGFQICVAISSKLADGQKEAKLAMKGAWKKVTRMVLLNPNDLLAETKLLGRVSKRQEEPTQEMFDEIAIERIVYDEEYSRTTVGRRYQKESGKTVVRTSETSAIGDLRILMGPYATEIYQSDSSYDSNDHSGSILRIMERIAADILDCMQKIHSKGYVHNDIKPDNILLVRDNQGLLRARISDFGLTKKAGQDCPGYTIQYASPQINQIALQSETDSAYVDHVLKGLAGYAVYKDMKDRGRLPKLKEETHQKDDMWSVGITLCAFAGITYFANKNSIKQNLAANSAHPFIKKHSYLLTDLLSDKRESRPNAEAARKQLDNPQPSLGNRIRRTFGF